MNEKPLPNDLVTMMRDDLSAPWPEKIGEKFYADAEQYRAWAATHQSEVESI